MPGACSLCRARKLKCDKTRPSCSRCSKLKIGRCTYPADKRRDKRKIIDGSTSFVFKNSHAVAKSHVGFLSAIESFESSKDEILGSEDPDVGGVMGTDYNKRIDEVKTAGIPEWPNLGDFMDLSDLDMDTFLRYLDAAEFADPDLCSQPVSTLLDQKNTPHEVLVDVVFENESHIPPFITRERLSRHMQNSHASSGEIFLLKAVMAIGALTLAKRDFATNQRSTDVQLPIVAAEAYEFYSQARQLLPEVIENPSPDGFAGLSLMANFMCILLTVEEQLAVCNQALEMAVRLGLHNLGGLAENSEKCGLVVAFWEVWCSSCMLSSFFGRPTVLSWESIFTTENVIKGPLSGRFFQMRVRFAKLHSKLYTRPSGSINREEIDKLTRGLDSLEEAYFSNLPEIQRKELLVLELKCWKSQLLILANKDKLREKTSMRSVLEAKLIIRELWHHYNPDFSASGLVFHHMDWNFSYPLRTATLCAYTATSTLLNFISLEDFMTFDDRDFKLGYDLLAVLVNMVPVNRPLKDRIDEMMKGDGKI